MGSDETSPERDALDELGSYGSAEIGIELDALRMLDFDSGNKILATPDLSTVFGCICKDWQGEGGLVSSSAYTTNQQLAITTPISPYNATTNQAIPPCEGELDMSDLMRADLYDGYPKPWAEEQRLTPIGTYYTSSESTPSPR